MIATIAVGKRVTDESVLGLIWAYRDRGDRRAIERLISMHEGILSHLVGRYAARSEESCEDLRQVGYVGLLKAVNGYGLDSEARFSTYAHSMIEGEIRHHLRDTALVKRPRWARSLYARITKATTRLTADLGRPPLIEEVAGEVNVTAEGVFGLMKLFYDTDVVSLDDGELDVSTIKSLRYETLSLPVEDRILLEQALESLDGLQRKVVYLSFYKDLRQTEIGRRLRLSQRKTSRTVASAIKAMKNSEALRDAEGVGSWSPE